MTIQVVPEGTACFCAKVFKNINKKHKSAVKNINKERKNINNRLTKHKNTNRIISERGENINDGRRTA